MMNKENSQRVPSVEEVQNNPAVSYWVKNALKLALERDPVDAVNDAQLLLDVLDIRAAEIIEKNLRKLSCTD